MPSQQKIDEVLATKPVTFSLKTTGGRWNERTRSATSSPAPGVGRTDSATSSSSSSSAGSTSSSH
ncbi:Uu.00g010200.m01.CDS01 [Anthostomella pinea]|uniref:Uu.00g010200.m01.CDS01 n=1 Tax=Anthostomella pinea TaxID=933095 RepID=A0AAI8VXI6_9PEZI|nr:Uu.00g010200.m01.CDS01 [Anthostomella pinea]